MCLRGARCTGYEIHVAIGCVGVESNILIVVRFSCWCVDYLFD